ncbi:MAG: leucine-rich repeat protein [Syntrophomonas sp.]|nr:leucine-rich repeat protein [Syntrophomonas sp.]
MEILKISKMNAFIIGIIIAAIMLGFSDQVQAAQEGDYTYTVTEDGKAEITKYTGTGGDVTIPSTLGGVNVTSIGNYAFFNCTGLTNITIAESVTSIGVSAFYGCAQLTGITIPEGVTDIYAWAFHKCTGLTSITIPASVTNIGDSFGSCTSLTNISVVDENLNYSSKDGILFNKSGTVLVQCPAGLTSITIPAEVISIGEGAFSGCTGLTGITLPEGVTSIGDEAFCGCTGLTSITLPEGVTSIGYETFWGCTGLTSITIPAKVTSIGDEAFSGCTGLTSITLPEGVTSIGNQAFTKCTSLASITLPQSITSIGEGAFGICGLTSITIPQTVTNIGTAAFGGCRSLNSITVAAENLNYSSKDGVLFDKEGTTLVQCPGGLTNVLIPQEVTAIADLAFSYCATISSIEIPEGVTSIGQSAFAGCTSLTSIAIPEGVTSIGETTFVGCIGLTSITIPEGVTSIGKAAFGACIGLTGITIPQTVISIGEQAFYRCMSLTSIKFNSEKTTIFDNTNTIPVSTTMIGYDPSAAKEYAAKYDREFEVLQTQEGDYTYTLTDGKAKITGYTGTGGDVTIPDKLGGVDVTRIGDYAFYGCTGLTGITTSVTNIGNNAFDDCTELTSITLLEGVTNIGEWAFYDCTGLTGITIPASVTSIGSKAFGRCAKLTSIAVAGQNSQYSSKDGVLFNKDGTILMACPAGLTSITIPIGVTSIGEDAFSNCTGLTSITIPQGVTNISDGAFFGCTGLIAIEVDGNNSTYASKGGMLFDKAGTILMACPGGFKNIDIPLEVTAIDDMAFSGCTGLSSITIPEKVTTIGLCAFSNCTGLTSIIIPQGVTNIGNSAFLGCMGLTSITLPQGVTSIGDSTFFGCMGLTSISIPEGVTSIGQRVFRYCASLTSITIPQTVISIDENAFFGCTSLTSIKFNSKNTTIFDNADTIPAAAKIIGYVSSTAKDYAEKYGRTFQAISSQDTSSNDGGSHSGVIGNSNSAVVYAVDIQVNGETLNEGIMTITQEGSITIATVTLDEKKFEQLLTQTGNNVVVTIPINIEADAVIGELNGQMIKNMEYKQAIAEIKTQNVAYTLSPQQINIDAVAAQLGTKVELKDIKVQIQISKPNTEMLKVVENSAKDGEFALVVPAVEFSVKCTCGDKAVELNRFNSYVKRTVAIPEGVNPNKITTAVVIEQDGTVIHVPTQIIQIDNKYYAQINSMTNSTYSVIWHPIEFKDVDKHWAKKEINDMGSRMIVSGINKENYEPDRDITRAEFAAIVVRALGLKPGNDQGAFSDVQGSEWFSSGIQTAYQYKVISGYGNGKFGATDKITREQAMTMIAKAMNITGLKVDFQAEDAEKILARFVDTSKTAEYARSSMIACVKTGIITGKGGNMVAPKDNITRAEVAVIVQKLLQKSKLI